MKAIKPKISKKWLVIIGTPVIVVVLGVLYIALFSQPTHAPKISSTQPPIQTPEPKDDDTITLAAMGDMIAHDSILAQAKSGNGYNFLSYFDDVKPKLGGADLIFCNPEGPVAGEQFGISGYPSFNAPTQYAVDLTKVGCNVINMANNHIADRGREGLVASIATWERQKPLLMAGANRDQSQKQSVRYATIGGVKVAFLAFAEFSNNRAIDSTSLNLFDEQLIRKLASEARNDADVVIVSMHWGTEDVKTVNTEQIRLAKLLSSLNVDIVIGTGPHVLQKVDSIKKADGSSMLCWYSLGNLLSSQLEIDQLIGGVAFVDIKKTDDGINIDNPRFTPTYMHYEWSSQDRAAENLSARTNFKLVPLKEAKSLLQKSHHDTTVDTEMQKVRETLGNIVTIQ